MDIKHTILVHLKNNQGKWSSGEDISRNCNLSRTAIWKHIQLLKNHGYAIESSPRKGYRLTCVPDLINEAEVSEGLETRTFGTGDFHYFRQIGSTNSHAAALAEKNAPEGTVVIAEEQTIGKGRRERSWFSPPGKGIYLSLVLRPPLSPPEAPKITLLTAVAAAETLISLTGLDIRIKWPNDLLVQGKKISGILTEMNADMERISHIIVGIGINVNTEPDIIPDEIRDIATSVLIESGSPSSRSAIAREFLKQFENLYERFLASGFTDILSRWKELSGIIGKKIDINGINSSISGTVVDVDDDGVLILEDAIGTKHRIFSGDVILPIH